MRILTASELLADPKPLQWLTPGYILCGAMHLLFGASGIGKTHILISLGHAGGTGSSFAGLRAVAPYSVLYVIAEGFGGIPSRVREWLNAHSGMDLERIRYIGEPVAFHLKEGVKELLDSLKAIEFTPALVIVDTLAATAPPGFDENSAAHFGEFLFGVQELQRALGCAILINHHTGWEGTRERGSSAFGARVDVKLFAERVGRTTTRLTVRKARDFAEGESLLLQLVPVGESVIVERAQNADALADGPRTVLKVLHDAPTALKLADWLERSPFERTKFYQLKAELVKAELVEKNELGAWYPSQKGVALLVSENGSRTTRGQSADSGVPNRSGSPSALRISRYGREPNGALNHESAHQNGQGSYEDDEREGMGR